MEEHPRFLLPRFISPELCQELKFVHRSCCTVGYRPNVFSTTLSHLIATNSSHLIIPFVAVRERLKEKVEEFFGCEYQLFIEFTGLISWCQGARIGWHSDDNQPYLKQRHFAVVCYLNSHGKDFKGGNFHFQDGEPKTIIPMAGDVLIYTADSRNIHSVDEIIAGERLTLTLWFTLDRCHDEDAKLLMLLSQSSFASPAGELDSYLPLPGPINMYWFCPDPTSDPQRGFDIRWARINILGCRLCTYDDDSSLDVPSLSDDSGWKDNGPLMLARGVEVFGKEFGNSLHALQVLQFYCWKASELGDTQKNLELGNKEISATKLVPLNMEGLKFISSGDWTLAESVLGYNCETNTEPSFNRVHFSAAVVLWNNYLQKLRRELLLSIPHWLTHQSIFCINLIGEDAHSSDPIDSISE